MIAPPARAATLVMVDPILLTFLPFSIRQAHMHIVSPLLYLHQTLPVEILGFNCRVPGFAMILLCFLWQLFLFVRTFL
jgi:hypothetical protein